VFLAVEFHANENFEEDINTESRNLTENLDGVIDGFLLEICLPFVFAERYAKLKVIADSEFPQGRSNGSAISERAENRPRMCIL